MLLRNKRSVLGFALMGLVAAVLVAPATASAQDGDRRDRGDRADDRNDDDRRDRGDRSDYRNDDRRRDDRSAHRGNDDRDRRDHRDADRNRGHDDHDKYKGKQKHASHKGHGNGPSQHKYRYNDHRPAHSYRQAAAHSHGSPYYCKPCNHRFESRVGFNSHLGGRHHIPPWRMPFVIVHHTFGWIFFG
jgi:hypothetical protein